MCEALIAVVDAVPSTDPLYAHNYLALDIIVVCEDGWPWSDAEINHPRWRIVKIPGVSTDFVSQYCTPRFGPDGPTGREMVRLRDWCLDVAKVPAAVRTYIQTHQTVTLTTQQAQQVATWVRKHADQLDQS